MNISNINILAFMPSYMQENQDIRALAYVLDKQLKKISLKIPMLQIYANIENVSEYILDELAYGLNAAEYSSEYDIFVKRQMIRSCIETHRMRGTVSSVEKVMRQIFGDGYITEWFDYDGTPYHFKVHTSNTSVTDDMVLAFERSIEQTQSIRSYLESVIVESALSSHLASAGSLSEGEYIDI